MALRSLLVPLLFTAVPAFLHSQTALPVVLSTAELPDSPSALRVAQSSPQTPAPPQAGTASISGQIEDFTGAAVPGALIHLDATSSSGHNASSRTLSADAAGTFRFGDLPSGSYRISATAPNMGTYVSAEIHLGPGQSVQLTKIALAIGPTRADIQVIATPQQIAAEQVREEEHQRVLGIFPSFYSSYIWDAAPLDTKQKYGLALHSILDPFAFVGAAAAAGIQQDLNIFPGYGSGPAAYGKRFGAAYATEASARIIGSAVLPSIFHQDPRYFYKGSGTSKERILYAIRSTFVTRGDNGRPEPNYSYLVGSFASGSIAYGLHAAPDRSISTIFTNGFLQIGAHAGDELIREFFLRRLTPHVPAYKQGQPPTSDKP